MDFIEEEAKVPLLIELIQNYEHLYNLGDRDYKNVKKKEESWKEVSQIINMPVEECKKTWKNLRDKFMREKSSGSGASDSSWPHFKAMLFYSKYCKPRKTSTATSNVSILQEPEPRPGSTGSSASVWSTMHTILSPDEYYQEEIEKPDEMQRVVECEAMDQQEILPYVTPTSRNTKGRKRKHEPDIGDVVLAANKIAETIADGGNNTNAAFTKYLHFRLQEMPPEEAKSKRKQILLILEED